MQADGVGIWPCARRPWRYTYYAFYLAPGPAIHGGSPNRAQSDALYTRGLALQAGYKVLCVP